MFEQKEIALAPQRRGFHLVTDEILQKLPSLPKTGLLHLFIKHTSAALTLNENADPDVRTDLGTFFDSAVMDGDPRFAHILEGSDDMSAHVKASMIGASVSIPIGNGRLNMGIWQGIYLCEFRNHAGSRHIVATIMGE